MQFVPGQRFLSTNEPELGCGIVKYLQHKRVCLEFPMQSCERTYSSENSPLQRIVFKKGSTVVDFDGIESVVDGSTEENGIMHYQCGSRCIPETSLKAEIRLTGPLDALLNSFSDNSSLFDFRLQLHKFRQRIFSSKTRGLVGPKLELLPHQYYIAQYITDSWQKRFILADEVGCGKTIEACLVLSKLLTCNKMTSCIILVPSSLVHQWFVELYRRFSLVSLVLSSDTIKTLESSEAIPLESERIVIVSVTDFAHHGQLKGIILSKKWDLCIVDEAHHLSFNSKEYESILHLSMGIERILMLTASPDVLDNTSFFRLMQLCDPVKYSDLSKFLLEKERYLELSRCIGAILSHKGLSTKEERFIESHYPDFYTDLKQAASDAEKNEVITTFADIHGLGRSMFRNSRTVIHRFPQRTVSIVSLAADKKEVATPGAPVVPRSVLLWIKEFCFEHRSQKTLVICTLKSDVENISAILRQYKNLTVALFHEEMTILQQDKNAAWFAQPEGPSVLISSEIGSEGRNFQFADNLVLADLPPDPEMLEQRIGRLDRIGRSAPVPIYVPVEENTFMHFLAQWYHIGMDAFTHIVAGGYEIGIQMEPEVSSIKALYLQKMVPDGDKVNDILCKTQEISRTISHRTKEGKNRLLQLHSFNKEKGQCLVCEILDNDTDPDVIECAEKIFDHFGILRETMSKTISHIRFDLLTDAAFPVPYMKDEGMLITFDRHTALVREDVDFMSMDHPMICDSIDIILNSHKGNSACVVAENTSRQGLFLEVVYLLEPASLPGCDPFQYLPPSPIILVIDQHLRDVTSGFDNKGLSQRGKNIAFRLLCHKFPDLPTKIQAMFSRAEELSATAAMQKRLASAQQLKMAFEKERTRLDRVHTQCEDYDQLVQAIGQEYTKLNNAIEASILRLDGIRLVFCK